MLGGGSSAYVCGQGCVCVLVRSQVLGNHLGEAASARVTEKEGGPALIVHVHVHARGSAVVFAWEVGRVAWRGEVQNTERSVAWRGVVMQGETCLGKVGQL